MFYKQEECYEDEKDPGIRQEVFINAAAELYQENFPQPDVHPGYEATGNRKGSSAFDGIA